MSDTEPLPSLSPVAGQTSDTRLIERAIKQRWPIKPEHKAAVVKRMDKIVRSRKASNREVASAAKALIACEAQNQSDEHHAEGEYLNVDHNIVIVEDGDWYGNEEKILAAQSVTAPAADPLVSGANEAGGLRPPLGQDGSGNAGLLEGPRGAQGGTAGSH